MVSDGMDLHTYVHSHTTIRGSMVCLVGIRYTSLRLHVEDESCTAKSPPLFDDESQQQAWSGCVAMV